jgi:hypothetical protein
METFKPEFEKFMGETEFGTSVYGICYEAGKVDFNLKEIILKLKYTSEDMQTVAYKHIPPFYMEELRELVTTYNEKLYDKIHEEA